uniref:Thrombomodulin n=1 Tax=Iconisemion striatum TaxID=60296 RepID=A0A1A7WC64_9TELE
MNRALILCGFWVWLRDAAAVPLVQCTGGSAPGLCLYQNRVDFREAEQSCRVANGQLAENQTGVLVKLPDGFGGRFWLRSARGTHCTAVMSGVNVTVLSVPCRNQLDGFVCRFKPSEVCGAVQVIGHVTYTTSFVSPNFTVVDSDFFPPGTVAVEVRSGARYPDSKQLCYSRWHRVPWSCEILLGGCEHGCEHLCTCPVTHALHPNNFSCVARAPATSAPSHQIQCKSGFEPSQDGTSCVDVDECAEEEDSCTEEGDECVNTDGGHECKCMSGFEEVDGACVNASICLLCEHMNCSRVSGEFRCVCRDGYRVSPRDPTRCEQHCSERVCRAVCHRDPNLEARDMQQCTCPNGYIVDLRNRTADCVDIDECEQQEMCDHLCENTFGSYSCACHRGFRLERGDRCVPLEEEEGEEENHPPHPPNESPQTLRPVLPSYIKTGSVLGITVFLVLCAAVLGCLVRTMTRRCGRLDLRHPDLDIFYLQQVTTETYKRLSFDKQSKSDMRL